MGTKRTPKLKAIEDIEMPSHLRVIGGGTSPPEPRRLSVEHALAMAALRSWLRRYREMDGAKRAAALVAEAVADLEGGAD